jgi:hypothetical protein
VERSRQLRTALSAAIVCLGTVSPLEWSHGRLIEATACADGTCCPEPGSLCIVNNMVIHNYYLKAGGGPCGADPTRPLPPL